MAESREGGALGGWCRDAASTRTSEAGSPWANVDGDAPGTATATLPMGPRGERASDVAPRPTALPGPPRGDAPTPIFDAVASGWEHRRQDERVADRPGFETPAGHGGWAAVPDPRSATGPVPVQRPRDPNGPRELAPVGVVPPPPPADGRHDDIARHRAGVASVAGRAHAAAVPEQRSGTGPVPVQRPRDPSGSGDLAPAGVVPPPPPRGGSTRGRADTSCGAPAPAAGHAIGGRRAARPTAARRGARRSKIATRRARLPQASRSDGPRRATGHRWKERHSSERVRRRRAAPGRRGAGRSRVRALVQAQPRGDARVDLLRR